MATSKEGSFYEIDDIREIFRHVSPYIIRQWKQVCRKLGIQELELAHLEANGYYSSKAQLAFKGLCLWYDHEGKSATKDKLMSALKLCGLHRAQEEIERHQHGRLDVSTSSSSNLASSSQTVTRRPRPGTGQRKGCVSRPSTRNGSASSNKRISSTKGTSQSVNKVVVGCELCLKLYVTQITPAREVSGVWREKIKEMSDTFYEAVLTNPEIHMEALERGINNREISVADIQGEGLQIRLKILTLGALESLNQMYKTCRLLAICQNVFISESSLKTVGAKHIGIKLEMDTENLDHCRGFFLSRKFKESIHPTDTLQPPSFNAQPLVEEEKIINNVLSDGWREKVVKDVHKIEERHAAFDETVDEFIRTLNIILPQDYGHINSLSDLLQLYSYVNKTHSVSSGVRLDLFREYLLIVNNVRLIVEEIKTNIQQTDTQCDDEDSINIVRCLLDDIDHMLQQDTPFEDDISALNRKISPSEKEFSEIICFVPLLLAKISTVLLTLSPCEQESENPPEIMSE